MRSGNRRVAANRAVKTASGDRSVVIRADSVVVDQQEQRGKTGMTCNRRTVQV